MCQNTNYLGTKSLALVELWDLKGPAFTCSFKLFVLRFLMKTRNIYANIFVYSFVIFIYLFVHLECTRDKKPVCKFVRKLIIPNEK